MNHFPGGKMGAAIFRKGEIVIDEMAEPTPGPRQVLVRTLARHAPDLVTGKVGLSGVAQAFDDLADPEAHTKIIVEPWR